MLQPGMLLLCKKEDVMLRLLIVSCDSCRAKEGN